MSDPDADRWNIAPQEKTPPPIIYRPATDAPPQVTQSMPWGITLPDRLLINAKMESANVHKANLSARRCIVPAHGYYEWFATAIPVSNGKPLKIPFVLSLPEDRTFYFAGLWGSNVRQTPLGSTGFVIMTGEPPRNIAWLHNRMPLVIPAQCVEGWLNPRLPYDQVREILNEVILKYSHGREWEVRPITPLPSGRNASDIPEPYTLPWWRASMGQVLAAIFNWRGEGAAQTGDVQTVIWTATRWTGERSTGTSGQRDAAQPGWLESAREGRAKGVAARVREISARGLTSLPAINVDCGYEFEYFDHWIEEWRPGLLNCLERELLSEIAEVQSGNLRRGQ